MMTTACPLSENLLASSTGAGTGEKRDNICTEVLLLKYCALLTPATVSTIVYVPLVEALVDKKNCPVRRDLLVNVADNGLVTTPEFTTPSRYITGTT